MDFFPHSTRYRIREEELVENSQAECAPTMYRHNSLKHEGDSEHSLTLSEGWSTQDEECIHPCDSGESSAASRRLSDSDFRVESIIAAATTNSRLGSKRVNVVQTHSERSSFEELSFFRAGIRSRQVEDAARILSVPENSTLDIRSHQNELSYYLAEIHGGDGLRAHDDGVRTPQPMTTPDSLLQSPTTGHNVSFTNLQYGPKYAPSPEAAPGEHAVNALERWVSNITSPEEPWSAVFAQRPRNPLLAATVPAHDIFFDAPEYPLAPSPEPHLDRQDPLGDKADSVDSASHCLAKRARTTHSPACLQIVFGDLNNDETFRSHANGAGDDRKTRKTVGSGKRSVGASGIGDKHDLPGSSDEGQGSKKRASFTRQIKEYVVIEECENGKLACPFAKLDPIKYPNCWTFSRNSWQKVKEHMYSKQANGHVHELTQAQRTGLKHAAGELEEEKWLNGFRFLFPNIEGYLVPEHAWKEDYGALAMKHRSLWILEQFRARFGDRMDSIQPIFADEAARIATDTLWNVCNSSRDDIRSVASSNFLGAAPHSETSHDMYGSSEQDSGFMGSELMDGIAKVGRCVGGSSNKILDNMDTKYILGDPPEPSKSSNSITGDASDPIVAKEHSEQSTGDQHLGFTPFGPGQIDFGSPEPEDS